MSGAGTSHGGGGVGLGGLDERGAQTARLRRVDGSFFFGGGGETEGVKLLRLRTTLPHTH